MIDEEDAPTRADRRRRSDAAILEAARTLFATRGFERTTIRAVAVHAGVDPALVMQNFGSKDGLFSAAARWSVPLDELTGAARPDLARVALTHALDAFEDPALRSTALAVLRSCLTHAAATEVMRDEVMGPAQAHVARTIGGPDAALRAALLNACTLGLSISRYLLEVPALAGADRADLEKVFGPALQALVGRDEATADEFGGAPR